MYKKTEVQNVINLDNHPILWELLKKYITYKEEKDSNYPKEQLTVLINRLIYDGSHDDIFDILLIEPLLNSPTINGFKIIDYQNLDLNNCPMLVEMIKLNLKFKFYEYKSAREFIHMLNNMFTHGEGEGIVEVILIEELKNNIIRTQINISDRDNKLLPKVSQEFIGEYIKRRYEENLAEIKKEEYQELITLEYLTLKKENRLHEIFEFIDFSEF